MPRVSDLVGVGLAAEAEADPHPDPRHNVPHPFWGEPPDVDTCQTWMAIVLSTTTNIEAELSFTRVGGRVVDDAGSPVSHEHYATWRKDRVSRLMRGRTRYRWLKEWSRNHGGSGKVGVPSTPPRPPADPLPAIPIAQANGRVLQAVVKRYGRLERLYDTLLRYTQDDDAVSWEHVITAMDGCAIAEAPDQAGAVHQGEED
jgi:hypothetical protein